MFEKELSVRTIGGGGSAREREGSRVSTEEKNLAYLKD